MTGKLEPLHGLTVIRSAPTKVSTRLIGYLPRNSPTTWGKSAVVGAWSTPALLQVRNTNFMFRGATGWKVTVALLQALPKTPGSHGNETPFPAKLNSTVPRLQA